MIRARVGAWLSALGAWLQAPEPVEDEVGAWLQAPEPVEDEELIEAPDPGGPVAIDAEQAARVLPEPEQKREEPPENRPLQGSVAERMVRARGGW